MIADNLQDFGDPREGHGFPDKQECCAHQRQWDCQRQVCSQQGPQSVRQRLGEWLPLLGAHVMLSAQVLCAENGVAASLHCVDFTVMSSNRNTCMHRHQDELLMCKRLTACCR